MSKSCALGEGGTCVYACANKPLVNVLSRAVSADRWEAGRVHETEVAISAL